MEDDLRGGRGVASWRYMEWPLFVSRRCRNAIWENFSQLHRVQDRLLWMCVGQIFEGSWYRELPEITFKIISMNFGKMPVKLPSCLKGPCAGSVVK